jgi:CBS domain-containing protein
MSLERFCRKSMAAVGPDLTVDAAAQEMRERHVGALVVRDAHKKIVGILTDRDIACRVVAERRDPKTTRIEEVMTREVITAHEYELIDEAMVKMRRAGVRRLPIVGPEGALVGLVSLDDFVVLLASELGKLAEAVRENTGP